MEVLCRDLKSFIVLLFVLCGKTLAQLTGQDMAVVKFVKDTIMKEIRDIPLVTQPLGSLTVNPKIDQNSIIRNPIQTSLNRHGQQSGAEPFSSVYMLGQLNSEDAKVRSMRLSAYANLLASKDLMGRFQRPFETYSNDLRVREGFREAFNCTDNPLVTCNTRSRFRTLDGSCNNIKNPRWGMSFTPQARYLAPDYDDGFDSPKTRSVIRGSNLPSARLVSNAVLRNSRDVTSFSSTHTMMLMSWGQFLDHDLTFTPTPTGEGTPTIDCCKDTNIDCFPISIPRNDPHFSNRRVPKTCMHLIRSSPSLENPCIPGPRQQVNQLTSFVDASNVYGSTKMESDALRSFRGGKLTVVRHNLPPADKPSVCQRQRGDYCMKAGDKRINEVPHLGAMHIAFLRYHNIVAERLARLNPHWNDERIFQETRRIIGALLQKITYEEYLPIMLNQGERNKYCLNPSPHCRYDPRVNPSIKNSFSTAALRVGHSMIGPFQAYFKRNYRTLENRTQIELIMNKPRFVMYQNGRMLPDLMRWVSSSKSAKTDSFLEPAVRNNLFLDSEGDSLDLGALNIQRGRDHGLPSYVKWREFCGLSRVNSFHDLSDHSTEAVTRLQRVYGHVNDIDLYAGALSETPLFNSEVGPTFSCILGKQFHDLKIGDRYWFESTDPDTGFSKQQIEAIKGVRLSKIVCETIGNKRVQSDIFRLLSYINMPVLCKRLPDLNLSPWKYSTSSTHYNWKPSSHDYYWQT